MNFALLNLSSDARVTHEGLVKIAAAVQTQLRDDYTKLWGVDAESTPATVQVVAAEREAPAGAVLVTLHDTLEAAGALGYHDVTPAGRPCIVVGTKAIFGSGGTLYQTPNSIAACISHECLEASQDPACNAWHDMPSARREDAREISDRTESDTYTIGEVHVSNFLGPKAFTNEAVGPFDHLGLLKTPWEIRPGGYALRRSGGPSGRVSAVWGKSYPAWKKAQKKHKRRALRRGFALPSDAAIFAFVRDARLVLALAIAALCGGVMHWAWVHP